MTGNIYTYGTRVAGKVLTKRILATPSFQQIYASYMTALMSTYYNLTQGSAFMDRMNLMHSSISSSIQQDYWHRLDLGMTFDNFLTNIYSETIYRLAYKPDGTPINYVYAAILYNWAQARYSSAAQQLLEPPPPSASSIAVNLA